MNCSSWDNLKNFVLVHCLCIELHCCFHTLTISSFHFDQGCGQSLKVLKMKGWNLFQTPGKGFAKMVSGLIHHIVTGESSLFSCFTEHDTLIAWIVTYISVYAQVFAKSTVFLFFIWIFPVEKLLELATIQSSMRRQLAVLTM